MRSSNGRSRSNNNFMFSQTDPAVMISKISPLKKERNSPFTYSNDESVEEGHFGADDDFNLVRQQPDNQDYECHQDISHFRIENDSTILKDDHEDDQIGAEDQENLSIMMDSIPTIRELMVLAEADSNGMIYFGNFFKLLKKLKVCQSQIEAQKVFYRINNQSYDCCSHEQFFLFFSKELKSINLVEITVTELLLRLALELFRVLGKEKLQLELRDIMNYNKTHKDLDIDFIQLLEMFEFYDNIYTGVIKRKQSIVQFFQNCVPKLTSAIKDNFIYELQDLLQNWRVKLDTSSTLKLKVYDDKEKEMRNIHRRVVKTIDNKLEKESIQGLLKKNFNLNFEVTVEDNGEKENHVESEIEDFFQENRPKNKGWLFRKSKKHQNKWSNLFFYIYHDNSHLISVKPTTLKREMDCENIELYKCSFIELLDYQETKKANMERRKLRNKNFMSVTEGEKQNTYNYSNDASKISNQTLNTQSIARKNEQQNFFLFDKSSNKSYLIRSEESLIIMSIISFHNKAIAMHEKNEKEANTKISEFIQMYSEYSGIIEIAMCNRKQINVSYTDLNSFSFKKQYLIIKQGKCRIYNMKQKDKINLMEYELKIDSRLPFTPSNPFSFMLEKVIKPEQKTAEEDAKKKEEQIQSQQSSVVMFNPSHNMVNNENCRRHSHLNSCNLGEKGIKNDGPINILNPKIMQYNQQQTPNATPGTPNNNKQGFFAKIFQKIYKKTPDRLVIAADSEYKRKQWIFTINFHKTMLVRMKKKNKASFGYYQSFNTNQFFSNLNTLENEFGQPMFPLNSLSNNQIGQVGGGIQITNPSFHQQQLALIKKQRQNGRSGFGSGDYKQSGQNQNKNPLKLSEVEGDNDYYDIFAQKDKEVVEEVKEEDEEQNDDSPKQTYKYNPNDYKDKVSSTQAATTQVQLAQNAHHSRQGSSHQPVNTIYSINAPQSNQTFTNYKQSILKTTEEGMYTMSFPQNNPFFKKSLVAYENKNLIMNSKEIRTFTDDEIWQKFLKHFLAFNHQYSEIDLSTFGTLGGDHFHPGGNNQSYQKSTTYTQPMSKSTPMSKFINHNAFVFNGVENQYDQGLEQHLQSLELNKTNNDNQDIQNNELQSHKFYVQQNTSKVIPQYQESTLFEELDEEYIEPTAQKMNYRQTVVHKQY